MVRLLWVDQIWFSSIWACFSAFFRPLLFPSFCSGLLFGSFCLAWMHIVYDVLGFSLNIVSEPHQFCSDIQRSCFCLDQLLSRTTSHSTGLLSLLGSTQVSISLHRTRCYVSKHCCKHLNRMLMLWFCCCFCLLVCEQKCRKLDICVVRGGQFRSTQHTVVCSQKHFVCV